MNPKELSYGNFDKSWKRLTKKFDRLIVKDTMDYLDFNVDLKKNLWRIIKDIQSYKYSPKKPYLHPSPKTKGVSRVTVVLDIVDALIYRYCIEQVEDDLFEKIKELKMGKNFGIYGGFRIKPVEDSEGEGFYERWFEEWKNMQKLIDKALEGDKYLVKTDIASYFENINILTLKDLVRSAVKEKREIVNLLFYFLENILFRFEYGTNTFTGLPQEDIDCSRILAYFFLNKLELDMISFCNENKAKYFRWVDDMYIIVNNEIEGKKALKTISESLRKIGLTASIEKTEIMNDVDARQTLFMEENKELDNIINRIDLNLFNKKNTSYIKNEVEEYYKILSEKVLNIGTLGKNWEKIVKRFYYLFSILKSDILIPEIRTHLKDFTEIASSKKIAIYLIRLKEHEGFSSVIDSIIEYLYSDENLYPQLETNLLETILYFNFDDFTTPINNRLKKLSGDILFKKNRNGYYLSDYGRALSTLLYYRFNNDNIDDIAEHYLEYDENDNILKKYMIYVSLTSENINITQKVLARANKEQDSTIQRLMNFLENISNYSKNTKVLNYLKKKNRYVYIHKNPLDGNWIKEEYNPIRVEILKELINKYKK